MTPDFAPSTERDAICGFLDLQGPAAGGVPLLAGDPVHEPVTADLGDRPVLPPADATEDGAHGMARRIGARLDEQRVRVLEQPVSRATASRP
jgi:hypothetical protein